MNVWMKFFFVAAAPSPGRVVFVGVYLALLVGILAMPQRLLGRPEGRGRWWRNLRVWAALICVAQIAIYALLG